MALRDRKSELWADHNFSLSAIDRDAGDTLLDLRAGIEGPDRRWQLGVYGRNLTNAYYWTSANHLVDTVMRLAGMSATYGISFSVKY